MCRSPSQTQSPAKRHRNLNSSSNNEPRSPASRSTSSKRHGGLLGYLRKPGHWAGAARKRIHSDLLRQAFLPRRPACLDLPTTKDEDNDSGSFHMKPSSVRSTNTTEHTRGTSMSSIRNEAWDEENPPKTRIKLLEELKNEPTKTREDLKQATGGANLDDIIDMAYKIRISYDFDWETLLEEDIEEEDEDMVAEEENLKPKAKVSPKLSRRARKRPSIEMGRVEKPALHLQRRREVRPAFGPGILIS